jgi:hypothetical protein
MTHVKEKTSAWVAERKSRIPGYFYTGIEGLGPKELESWCNQKDYIKSTISFNMLLYIV